MEYLKNHGLIIFYSKISVSAIFFPVFRNIFLPRACRVIFGQFFYRNNGNAASASLWIIFVRKLGEIFEAEKFSYFLGQ